MKKQILTLVILASLSSIIFNVKSQIPLADIDAFIENEMEKVHKPGLSACIIKDDSIVWRGNYGFANVEEEKPVNQNTLFYAYSIGKAVTAASIMNLWEEGLIDLDEDINDFLPFQINNPHISNDSISPRMLMTHTGSIVDDVNPYITIGDPTISLAYFLENYLAVGGEYYSNSNFSSFLPGTNYDYSNYGSALNGYIAEALLDIPFKEYADSILLCPLQMYNSAWFLNEIDLENLALGYQYSGSSYTPYPNYGHPAYPGLTLKSSSEELAHFLNMLMNSGNYQGQQLLESSTVDTMTSLQMNLEEMGLGLYKRTLICANETKTLWGHKGGGANGYASEMYFCPLENIGVIYMSNNKNYMVSILRELFEYGALIVIPSEATDISQSSFTANWEEAPDGLNYFLDVAYNWQFTNFVEGYENLDVGSGNSFIVDNLSDIQYYYRLRANNGVDTGAYSSSIHVTLPTGLESKQKGDIKIWSSNSQINIQFNQPADTKATAKIYDLSGRLLGKIELDAGVNSYKINIDQQIVLVNIANGKENFTRKVMIQSE